VPDENRPTVAEHLDEVVGMIGHREGSRVGHGRAVSTPVVPEHPI